MKIFKDLTFEDSGKAFKLVKRNKTVKHEDIDSNIMIFHSSCSEDIYLEQLKVAKVSPVFKTGKTEEEGNYTPKSLLRMFSKVFQRIAYNRTFSISKKMTCYYQNNLAFR